jgi:mono/diheme cytochrome c family protein
MGLQAVRCAAVAASSFPHLLRFLFAFFALALTSLACASCDRPPSADSLSEWTPADHHSADDNKPSQGKRQGAASNGERPQQGGSDVSQLVDIAWRQQCTSCHGPTGKGDGQMGPMVHAPDLTQSKVTDAEMAAVIKNGKGKMPKFDVPDPVIQGLVARVRASQGR